MPSSLRTALAPPSQPTRYFARISSVRPSVVRTRAVTPSASCASDRNSQPKRTSIAGMVSAMDFNSGSSVYCEIS